VALNVRKGLDCMANAVADDTVESLWVRMKGKANEVGVLVGVFYQPASQDEDTNELFYKELRDTSVAPVLSTGEDAPRVLCSVLGPSLQERP